VAGFVAGRGHRDDSARLRRLGISITVLVNLGLLGFFKYANFFVEQMNTLGNRLGFETIAWTSIALPIGISFFTFQSMSYTIDVARGRSSHITNPVNFALYVALFPQLIAGPIVRFHEIAEEIGDRATTLDGFAIGAVRFSHGLVKKVIIADAAGAVAEPVFGLPAGDLTTTAAWLGVVAYTLQIYFDFSGYSDMAIGLGRMFGFNFPENFRRPYSALSITDFWRRWHITLSNWFRDYLYIPLGGSRNNRALTYRNLVIVFLLTGFWHGANWTFVIWGIYHGALLMIERATGQRAVDDPSAPAVRRLLTLLLVMIGWVIFRADSLGHAISFLQAMFTYQPGGLPVVVELAASPRIMLIIALASAVVLLPRDFVGGLTLTRKSGWRPALGRTVLMFGALPYAAALISTGTFSPFLYYQF
jgi:alginate O-acetyltransferase complex protein AlgI